MSEMPALDRRSLLLGGAAAALVSTAVPATATHRRPHPPGNLPLSRIGATTFSVQDQANALGYPKLFALLREMGYRAIEFSGFNATPAVTPKDVGKLLADNDLVGVGNKASMNDASIDAALQAGIPWTGISVLTAIHGTDTAGWKRTADDLNTFGETCVKRGLKGFFVHMHGPEYAPVSDAPQRRAIEVLLENTDPRYVSWEMDLFWAYSFSSYVGGSGRLFDPLAYVLANPRRFPFFHVKDGKAAEATVGGQSVSLHNPNILVGTFPVPEGTCDVGQGHVPFRHFFGALAKVSRLEDHWYFWERDFANQAANGSLTAARSSYFMMANNKMADPTAP